MKPRFYLILAVIIIIIVILIGLAANAANQTLLAKPESGGTITVTIEKNVGIDRITYENIDNPGEIKTLTIIDLPYSFNCSRGDTLVFNYTARAGYVCNSLDFSPTGRSNRDNPLLIESNDPFYCYNNKINITPTFIYLRVSPSNTPLPTVTPIPSPTPTVTPSPTP